MLYMYRDIQLQFAPRTLPNMVLNKSLFNLILTQPQITRLLWLNVGLHLNNSTESSDIFDGLGHLKRRTISSREIYILFSVIYGLESLLNKCVLIYGNIFVKVVHYIIFICYVKLNVFILILSVYNCRGYTYIAILLVYL